MKRFLLLLCTLLLTAAGTHATPTFKTGEKYKFVCKSFGYGSIVLGSQHSSTAYIYYDLSTDDSDDSWWYVETEGNGYTLRNASSGAYITYSSERIETMAKGLVLSTSSSGTASQWTIAHNADNYYTITNVGNTNQRFNVRVDGTYLVGTYASSIVSDNELFEIYDSSGNLLTEDGSSGGESSSDVRSDFNATKGITLEGEYWELKGLSTPVVYTTDTSNPVLYSIANLRSSMYVQATDGYLAQTSDAESRTHFYFVHSYYADPADARLITGVSDYGLVFTCAVAAANIFAMQFHPEKSAEHGLRLYRNFVDWNP